MDKQHSVSLPDTYHDRGFSLITTLLLLIIVTGLGIAASQIVLMGEKTSRFDRDAQIAFQAAEAALIDAELDIQGPNTYTSQRMSLFAPKDVVHFTPGCGTLALKGMCAQNDLTQRPVWYDVDFTDRSANAKTVQMGDFTGRTFSTGTSGPRSETAPRYIIEVIPDPAATASTGDVVYRITSMGFGPSIKTQVVLQVILRKA
jgi:type IV pilus assembly protein PilX